MRQLSTEKGPAQMSPVWERPGEMSNSLDFSHTDRKVHFRFNSAEQGGGRVVLAWLGHKGKARNKEKGQGFPGMSVVLAPGSLVLPAKCGAPPKSAPP